MPFLGCSCSGGLWATALVVFLALPVQYYVPDFSRPEQDLAEDPLHARVNVPSTDYFHWISLKHLPPFDLFLTITLLLLAAATYFCDWIQRKLMEHRIIKLNRELSASVERLRAWDVRQEQLESTLRAVQQATAEYNLLLYLLLRAHRALGPHKPPPSRSFFEKDFDDLNFITNPTIDV